MRLVLSTLTLAFIIMAPAPAGLALSQSPYGHKHGGQGHDQPGRADAEAHRRVDAHLKEFDRVVADGRGFGLAFSADQNGYPGPLHVLELKERLKLTPSQEAGMTTLFDAMLAEARVKAARLADAEARLRRIFAEGNADDGTVRVAVAEAERARVELRLAHLLTHLRTRDLLTEDQRQIYHRLRWGTAAQ
jgi:Spy/CpxP family protein refolding chaperone